MDFKIKPKNKLEMAIKDLAVSWIKTANFSTKNLAILNEAANLATLDAAGANWQRWAPIENGAILSSFLAGVPSMTDALVC